MVQKIDSFTGKYAFLSNFYKCTFFYRGEEFPTAEHAFVFEKDGNKERFVLQYRGVMLNQVTFDDFLWLSPREAKHLGHRIVLRDSWNDLRIGKMYDILSAKFSIQCLEKALRETGNDYLVEGNSWGDTFWGVCNGKGHNHLGKLLMEARDSLSQEIDF